MMLQHVSLLKKKIIKVIFNDVQEVFYIKKKFLLCQQKVEKKVDEGMKSF